MPDSLTSLLIGSVGAAAATALQYAFRRYTETQQLRREIVETRLLQLQNSVESLYYRANNLLDWSGRSEMSDEYYEKTTVFVLARVLAHETLLASTGIYAKLGSDQELKFNIKAALHQLNSSMDEQGFLYYHRVQLGEMAVEGDRVVTFTEFLARWSDVRFKPAVPAASTFVASVTPERLQRIREQSGQLVGRLAKKTGVPSALALTGWDTSRAPA